VLISSLIAVSVHAHAFCHAFLFRLSIAVALRNNCVQFQSTN
jgi:hypothetical protein